MTRLQSLIPVPRAAASALLLAAAATAGPGDDWPQWRGPHPGGVSSASDLPLEWSAETNVVWRTPLPYWCGSTPIVVGERIFATSPSSVEQAVLDEFAEGVEEMRKSGDRRGLFLRGKHPGGQDLLLLCLSRSGGEVLWQRVVASGNELHMKSNDASPSPVSDGERVWIITGTGHLVAYDFAGEELWRRDIQADYGPFGQNWGFAASPLLHAGQLILPVLHGTHTDEASYILSIDGQTGETTWRVERPTDAPAEAPDAYTTPILVDHPDGPQVVISGGDYVTGHDPESGEELWRVGGLNPRNAGNYRIVASPLHVDGIVYAPTRVRPLLAIELGVDGRPDDDSVLWRWDRGGAPDVPTPVCDGEFFYMVDDKGLVSCLDAKTGKALWGPERTVQGTVSGSPLLADGRLHFTNEEAVTVVLAAGPEYELLATNELDGSYTISSPVAVGNRLYVRTGEALYCIGKP